MTHEITTQSGADHVYQITVNVSCLLRHIALTPPSGACARPPAVSLLRSQFFKLRAQNFGNFGVKTRENVVVLDFSPVGNFDFTDFTRKIVKKKIWIKNS